MSFPIHPLLVHFPIALFSVGSVLALLYLLGWRRLAAAPLLAWGMLALGWLGLFAAILTGLIDRNREGSDAALLAVLNPHTALGFALLAVYGWLLYWRLRWADVLDRPALRARLVLLLALGLAVLLVESWLGGRLVYELGVGVRGG